MNSGNGGYPNIYVTSDKEEAETGEGESRIQLIVYVVSVEMIG